MTAPADLRFMKRALQLAARRKGWTSPNPCVGAVVVKGGRIVGEGVHRAHGEPHAEPLALAAAGTKARGATVYVNLEPCCHVGATPPCVDAIIAAGVKRVVAAMTDPNPNVNGGGFAKLKRAGIASECGLLEAEARRINEDFIKLVTTGRPFVTLKLAMSLDGKIATRTGESKWITGAKARAAAHRLRHEHDAVMVGINTALADDPELTCRLPGQHRQPTRVIVDSRARLPLNARCISNSARTIVAASERAKPAQLRALSKAGVETITVGVERVNLLDLMAALGERNITSVLIEGGGTLAASALDAGLIDKVILFIAPMLIGGAESRPGIGGRGVDGLADAWRLRDVRMKRVGGDWMIEGYVHRPD